MRSDLELLTASEAAVLANVTVRDINRVIDEKIIPERFYSMKGGRRIHVAACPLVGFYFHAAKVFTSEERSLLIGRLCERIGPQKSRGSLTHARKISRQEDWTVIDGFVTVSLWEFVTSAESRHAKLAEAREMVVEDPAILNGAPVFRGTRIPVHDIAASLAAGLPHARIRAAYARLDDRMIELAAIYAEATPPRGRPRQPVAQAQQVKVAKVARRLRA